MITNSEEFQKYQKYIVSLGQKYNPPVKNIRLPTFEPIYEINWDTRKVEAPEYLGVEGDHEAEYIFFRMDRYVDAVDLSDCMGVVCFKNANNEEYYQLLSCYDISSEINKIIFGWDISGYITKYSGTVQFSFKFFRIVGNEIAYEINTRIAKSLVYSGWFSKDGYQHNYLQMNADQFLLSSEDSQWIIQLQDLLEGRKTFQVYWLDV